MLIDDLREWAGDEAALKIAAKYGGTRKTIPTEAQVQDRIRLDKEIYDRSLTAPLQKMKPEFKMGYTRLIQAILREQDKQKTTRP